MNMHTPFNAPETTHPAPIKSDRGLSSLFGRLKASGGDAAAKLDALEASMATIEFDAQGNILCANPNFLQAMGYGVSDIVGKHHRMFVEDVERNSDEYRQFWEDLRAGTAKVATFKRIGNGGRTVWIQAVYTPVRNTAGKVVKVFKACSDITSAKLEAEKFRRESEAIGKSLAVIHFNADGTIIEANGNFLDLMEYSMSEIAGQHHSMFVEPAYADSKEYADFWQQLRAGHDHVSEFQRFTKSGKSVWIQGSYSAVLDPDGQVERVIKVASDITAARNQAADHQGQIAAINRSQAVIHFELDGTIIDANDAFLATLGYSKDEIVGQHHRMFVASEEQRSAEYEAFWDELRKGKFQQAEFRRVNKAGDEIWIQATYNPIIDSNGNPVKVVKFATDITAQHARRMARQSAQSKIAHDLSSVSTAVNTAKSSSAEAATASEQASHNFQAVASGAEEMNGAIQEIATSMVRSRETADEAHSNVASANQACERFLEAAQSMGQIVELIRGIAGQINLLSLNATIESARAGEAGKGFAVVASEVKSLARQAADATDKVAAEIESVQAASGDVDQALQIIGTSLETVREYVVGTSSAVEEQSAVARDISQNMQEASQGIESVSDFMQRIADETARADAAVENVAAESQSMLD